MVVSYVICSAQSWFLAKPEIFKILPLGRILCYCFCDGARDGET